jgi:hypothetical protein
MSSEHDLFLCAAVINKIQQHQQQPTAWYMQKIKLKCF